MTADQRGAVSTELAVITPILIVKMRSNAEAIPDNVTPPNG